MANPAFIYLSTYSSRGPQAQSAFMTFSYANSAGFEAFIPITVRCPNTANLSAGAEVYVMRSVDGGVTFETILDAPLGMAFSKPAAAAVQTKDLVLRDPGLFVICVLTGGGSASTWSVDYGATIAQITAYA